MELRPGKRIRSLGLSFTQQGRALTDRTRAMCMGMTVRYPSLESMHMGMPMRMHTHTGRGAAPTGTTAP